jgi:hypothetical protein
VNEQVLQQTITPKAFFESLGVFMEREIVNANILEGMFLIQLAWESMKPFVVDVRQRFGEEEGYASFERLHEHITSK